ncbi:MAG: hypothetical protein PVH18_13825 [Chloroflexota bacterium]|jgi:hypothetical protein
MSDAGSGRPRDDLELPEGMTVYYLGLLRRGPAWTPEVTPATEQLQVDHLAHIRGMAESGALLMAGPFLDGAICEACFSSGPGARLRLRPWRRPIRRCGEVE